MHTRKTGMLCTQAPTHAEKQKETRRCSPRQHGSDRSQEDMDKGKHIRETVSAVGNGALPVKVGVTTNRADTDPVQDMAEKSTADSKGAEKPRTRAKED